MAEPTLFERWDTFKTSRTSVVKSRLDGDWVAHVPSEGWFGKEFPTHAAAIAHADKAARGEG